MHSFAPFPMLKIFAKKVAEHFANFSKILANFDKKLIADLCKGVHCVDLGESFPTHIYLQNFVSIQPRTSPVKFAASRSAVDRFPRPRPAAASPEFPMEAKHRREKQP